MHHYSIDMRKMKRVIVISFVPFFLIWFIALNLIYTVKAVRKAFEIPNVTIQLLHRILLMLQSFDKLIRQFQPHAYFRELWCIGIVWPGL